MTKKSVLTLFLSLFLLAGLFAASVMVHAEDPAEPAVPDDAFDGAYEEFKGSDGTVTQVFDNGSVITTYKDGSKFGVDYAGNQHAKATDGTYSVGLTDGSIAIEYPDGRQSQYEPDKDTITTINPDSTMTREYVSLGLVADMNAEGEQTGIGFIGSGERLSYNEDGTVADGTIKGPNGASLTVDDGNVTAVSPEGKKMEYRYNTSTDDDPAKEIIRIEAPDGSTAEREISINWEQAADGTWQRCEETSETIKYADGTAISRNINEIFHDEYGFSSEGRFIEETWTSADGETFTRTTAKFNDALDPDSGESLTGEASKWEYTNPNTGEHAATDFFGHPVDLQKDGVSYHAEFDENGKLSSVDMSEDGHRFIGNPDGTWSFTRKDGTVFNGDKENMWKNGTQIQKDGKWVEGYDPSEDFGNDQNDGQDPAGGNNPLDWNGNFFGTELPPLSGRADVSEYTVKDDSITVRIDGVSYGEYIDYCTSLEMLPGWVVYEGDYPEDVAHFPDDYNIKSKIYFSGSYGDLPHISVQYYSDKQCESSGYPHFAMFVFKDW